MVFRIGDIVKIKDDLKDNWWYHNNEMKVIAVRDNDVVVDYIWSNAKYHKDEEKSKILSIHLYLIKSGRVEKINKILFQ